jgi:hypothetical protein
VLRLQLQTFDALDRPSSQVKLAVAVGFEPTRACALHTFEVCDPVISVGHESTIPSSQAQSGHHEPYAVRTDCNQKCNRSAWRADLTTSPMITVWGRRPPDD